VVATLTICADAVPARESAAVAATAARESHFIVVSLSENSKFFNFDIALRQHEHICGTERGQHAPYRIHSFM
jgi:hypothetical protein